MIWHIEKDYVGLIVKSHLYCKKSLNYKHIFFPLDNIGKMNFALNVAVGRCDLIKKLAEPSPQGVYRPHMGSLDLTI